MRLAAIKPDDLAVVTDDGFIPVGDTLAQEGALPRGASMIDLITQYDSLKGSIASAIEKGSAIKLDPKQLRPPVERPSKIWAAAFNFRRGTEGLGDTGGRGEESQLTPEQILEMTFLKPSSRSVTMPRSVHVRRNSVTLGFRAIASRRKSSSTSISYSPSRPV